MVFAQCVDSVIYTAFPQIVLDGIDTDPSFATDHFPILLHQEISEVLLGGIAEIARSI